MSVYDVFESLYVWAAANALWFMVAAVAIPSVGTVVAWIGRGGKTDADGRFTASIVVGVGLCAVIVEVIAIVIVRSMLEIDVLQGDIVLLAAPIVCLVGGIVGIRMVFPLNELASVRSFIDIGVFVLVCLVVVWLFGKFRGWGIIFWGGITQLLVIGALLYFLLRRLYRRAFGS